MTIELCTGRMKLIFLNCVLLCFILQILDTQAIECGISESSDHETIRKMANTCLKNGSRNKNRGSSGGSSRRGSSGSSDDEGVGEENEETEDDSEMVTTTASSRRPLRSRTRSKRSLHHKMHGSSQQNNNKFNQQQYNPNNYPNNNQDNNQTEKCTVISCILTQLRMTDRRGFPDKALMVQVLTKNARSTEFREFLQESVDDCFEILGSEPKKDSCEFSTQLINCLAEKGKNSCDDWREDNAPF